MMQNDKRSPGSATTGERRRAGDEEQNGRNCEAPCGANLAEGLVILIIENDYHYIRA